MFRNLLLKAKSKHEDKKNIGETDDDGDAQENHKATLSSLNENNYICNGDAQDLTNYIETDDIEEMKCDKQNVKNEFKDIKIEVEYTEEDNGKENDNDIHNMDMSMEETSFDEIEHVESIGIEPQNEINNDDYNKVELVHNELVESESDNIGGAVTAGVPEQIDPGYDTKLEIKSILEKKCRKIKENLQKRIETESNKKVIIKVALKMMNGINELRKESIGIFDNIQEREEVTQILDEIKKEMEDLIRQKLEYIYSDEKYVPVLDVMKFNTIKMFDENEYAIENESGEVMSQNFKEEGYIEGKSEIKEFSDGENEESFEDLDNLYVSQKSTKTKRVQNKEKISTLKKEKRKSDDQLYMELKENFDFSFDPELKYRVENHALEKEERNKWRVKLYNSRHYYEKIRVKNQSLKEKKSLENENKIYKELTENFDFSNNPELKYRVENHTLGKEELNKLKIKLDKRRRYEKIIANPKNVEARRKRDREKSEQNKPLREKKLLEKKDKIYLEIEENFDFSGDPEMQFRLENKTLSKEDIRKLQKKLWSRRWYEMTRANTENSEHMRNGKLKYEKGKLKYERRDKVSEEKRDLLRKQWRERSRLYRENRTQEMKDLQRMKNKIRQRNLRNKQMEEHIKVLKMRQLIDIKQEHIRQIEDTFEGATESNHFEENIDNHDEFMNTNNEDEDEVYEETVEHLNAETNESQENELTDNEDKEDEASPQHFNFMKNESQKIIKLYTN